MLALKIVARGIFIQLIQMAIISNSHLLYNSSNYEWGADWTADGRSIIFTSDEADTGVIYIMNANGSSLRKITEQGSYPSWVK